MAVSVGFEPTVRLHAHNFSRVAPSAARTRYRDQDYWLNKATRNRELLADVRFMYFKKVSEMFSSTSKALISHLSHLLVQ